MAKNTTIVESIGNIEYKMEKAMADALLKARKGEDKKKHPQEYLCSVVNEQFGVKGNCVKVLFF
jgi:hypothetical protein